MFKKTSLMLITATLLVSLLGSTVFTSKSASAVTASDWSAGRIIDDVVFTNKDSMSVAQIQTFLNNKVGTGGYNSIPGQCDTNGTRNAAPYDSSITRASYAASIGYPTKWTCLNNYYEVPKTSPGPGVPANNYGSDTIPAGAKSAAQLIWDAAQAYNISPKVLLVTIHKESAGPLTTDDWPWQSQYTYAMGAYCPDSGPGGSANCDPNYAGFSIQIRESAALMRWYLDSMDQSWWSYKKPGNNTVLYNPKTACGSSNIFIENKATAALYTYTPYQPNQAALNNMYGTGDGCSAYGNRNFWRIYNDWFGTTLGFIHAGVSYTNVFDHIYYANTYPDVARAYGNNASLLFNHFVNNGLSEGRQGNSAFNINSYRTANADLRSAYGNDLNRYVIHYILYGKAEGRVGTGDYRDGTTTYNGTDYSSVYSFDYYTRNNPDIWNAFGLNDIATLKHFVNSGMAESRSGVAEFNALSYMRRYADVRHAYSYDIRLTTRHYILYGKAEGRVGTGDYRDGTTTYNGTDYSSVYSFDYYTRNNPDIWNAFGLNDIATLKHFVNSGMAESRSGVAEFNVTAYKNRYSDLQAAYGNDLPRYYLHFIRHGKAEGRSGAI